MESSPPLHIEIPLEEEPKKDGSSFNFDLSKTHSSMRNFKYKIELKDQNEKYQIDKKTFNIICKPNQENESVPQSVQEKNVSIVESDKKYNLNIHNNDYLEMRSKFMLKVYGILLTQLLFIFSLILTCQIKKIKEFLFEQKILLIVLMSISLLAFIVIFIIFLCKPNILNKVPHNYICILIVTIAVTILLVYISILYPVHLVIGAMSFVLAICLSIFLISLFNKIDIRYLVMAIILLSSCAFDYGLLALIYRSYYLHFVYCLIGGVIYTLYIAFDTISIRDHFRIDDYAFAALTLYLDIVRLFIQILRILGNASNKK